MNKQPNVLRSPKPVITFLLILCSSLVFSSFAFSKTVSKKKKVKKRKVEDVFEAKSVFDNIDSSELASEEENDFSATRKVIKKENDRKNSAAELDSIASELKQIEAKNEKRKSAEEKSYRLKVKKDREILKRKLAKQKKLEKKWRNQVKNDSRFPDFDENAKWDGLYSDH